MGMPLNLILVRHGESEGNVATHASKQGDDTHILNPEFNKWHSSYWHLTDKGINQAAISGQWIKDNLNLEFDRYYTSTYTRAMETAAYLNLDNASWYTDGRLREREYGKEGLITSKERETLTNSIQERNVAPLYWKPLNGESIMDCCIRIRDFLETLHREMEDKNVIIVCHGEVMQTFQIVLERWTHIQYKEYCLSKDADTKVYNGQIIHYTKLNPFNNNISKYLSYKRNILPNNPDLIDSNWKEIVKQSFSNDDLLKLSNHTPRIIK